ncbi:MAG: DUF1854 domain-containing protein [Clostridia bacterium]|nr:DUF1854 domain-containing protein [Clostridia bacterium]
MNIRNENELLDAAGIVYLTPENCTFAKKGDFLSVTLKESDRASYEKVSLHRLFPYDKRDEYISVLDTDNAEIGIITKLDNFKGEENELLCAELKRKYYICKLLSVLSVRDRFGFSYWKAMSADGEVSFTIRDAHNSIRTNSNGKIQLTDIDNNRYELEPFDTLDSKTRKRIELYV